MKPLGALAVLLLAATVTAGGRLTVHVSHPAKLAPAELRIEAIVEPATDNRALEVVAESEDFFRSSTVELHGENGPRLTSIVLSQLPAGCYEVSVRVLTSSGHELAAAAETVIIG